MRLNARRQRIVAAVVTIIVTVVGAYFAFVPFAGAGDAPSRAFANEAGISLPSRTCWPAVVSAWRDDTTHVSGDQPLTALSFAFPLCRSEARHRLTLAGLAFAVAFVAGYGFWRPRWPPRRRRRRIAPV